ncbi:MAG: hypothetical protein ACT6S0_21480 [Roseateles sp.]|uniref:hypothetical protein n=1 Tax=Roseateles sp. TaxID=1971397 RepID=UPI00403753C2
MTPPAKHPPLLRLFTAVGMQILHRPYLSLSVAVHAVAAALLYGFGSYQTGLSERAAEAAEVASSLRATSQASTAKRLQDLQAIKELLEKSADRMPAEAEPERVAASAAAQTPQEMVERARELSKEIDTLDKDIQAEELARLTGAPKSPPAGAPLPAETRQPHAAQASAVPTPVTPEMAASEVAALEARARATLAKRQQRLEAKANGVQVQGRQAGADGQGAAGNPAAAPAEVRDADTSVLAEITDFIRAGEPAEQTTRPRSYAGQTAQLFDQGKGQIPPVDATGLVRGHGRMLGPGGEYANRVYLNSWYLIGPFPGRHGAGMFDNPPHPPETAVLLDAVYYGKDRRVLKWRYVTAQSYPLVPPDQAEDAVYYGYTEVSVDEACDLTAWIGADDDVQIYLNDRLVWKGGNVNKQSYFDAVFNGGPSYLRDYNRTEGQRVLHFNKGRNRLFFKLSNGPNDAFLSMVLTR